MTDLAVAAAVLGDANAKLTIFQGQMADWFGGTATGGPNGDGRYPFTMPDGTTVLVACPAANEAANDEAAADAENARAAAVAAALEAANSAIMATVATPVHADEATGRAAVADGAQFRCKSTDGRAIEIRTRVDSGSSTLVTSIFTKTVADEIQAVYESVVDGVAQLAFIGPNGTAWMTIDADGIHEPNYNALKATVQIVAPIADTLAVASADPAGFGEVGLNGMARFLVSENEVLHPALEQQRRTALATERVVSELGRDVEDALGVLVGTNHIVTYGQSTPLGPGIGLPKFINPPRAYFKQFVGGQRALEYPDYEAVHGAGTARASLIPLRDYSVTVAGTSFGQTWGTFMLMMYEQLLYDRLGVDLAGLGINFLFSLPGQGSQTAAALAPGGLYFPRLQADMDAGFALSSGNYLVKAMPVAQGEADHTSVQATADAWGAQWLATRDAVRAYNETLTGMDVPVPLIFLQNASHNTHGKLPLIPMKQAALAATDDHVSLAGVTYDVDFASGEHPDTFGQAYNGAKVGAHLFGWFEEKRKPRYPSWGTPIWGDKSVIIPVRDAIGGVTVATDWVSDPGNFGAEFVDADGVTPIAMATPQPVRGGVRFDTTGSALPSGAEWRYGWNLASGDLGRSLGPRGCFRDNRGAQLRCRFLDSFPMHQFLPIDRKVKP